MQTAKSFIETDKNQFMASKSDVIRLYSTNFQLKVDKIWTSFSSIFKDFKTYKRIIL